MAWWPNPVPFRLRIFFRGAFLLLTLATVGLALSELHEERQLSYRGYREVFRKNVDQITARLQHPTGQLALLNPSDVRDAGPALRPLLLPFAAIDFDDRAKAQQAVEMAGCLVQYPDQARLCVAVGNNPFVGGFIYTVGEFESGALVAHTIGDNDLTHAHRLRVEVSMRGVTYRWVAPLETADPKRSLGVQGRLTGFPQDAQGVSAKRPTKEFRGWLWQEGRCVADSTSSAASACRQRTFFSVRLPVEMINEGLFQAPRLLWPPPDLAQIKVHVQIFAPGNDAPLFDSEEPGATAPFALADLRELLAPGEILTIRKLPGNLDLISLRGTDDPGEQPTFLNRIIRWLPVQGFDGRLEATRVISTAMGDYALHLTGDPRSVDQTVGLVATRLSWFVVAMLVAIVVTWIAIEARIIRRITLLTTRAAAVKRSVHAAEQLLPLDLRDLRGRDELGLLATVLADLLQRVNEDIKREQIRADQEKDMLHAVGHEILSPLQSLMALHAERDDPSLRYIRRMQQAIRLLYGSASPSEAILSAALPVSTLDLTDFLRQLADNSVHAGIVNVVFQSDEKPLMVKADAYALEDVITHVLTNAERYRLRGSAIQISLQSKPAAVEIHIRNEGPRIDAAILGRIFEYGVSDAGDKAGQSNRGQGLFVAKTYMSKMGGTIEAVNLTAGVEIVLTLATAA